jgi:hypothetical protein
VSLSVTLGQVARMRYTVHAERHRLIIEFRVGTAIEAISKAWKVMGDAAAGVYIYDDEVDAAYWPDQFSELVQVIRSRQHRIRRLRLMYSLAKKARDTQVTLRPKSLL